MGSWTQKGTFLFFGCSELAFEALCPAQMIATEQPEAWPSSPISTQAKHREPWTSPAFPGPAPAPHFSRTKRWVKGEMIKSNNNKKRQPNEVG